MAICCHYRSANSYFARWWVEGGFASEPNPNRTANPTFLETRTLDPQKLGTRTRLWTGCADEEVVQRRLLCLENSRLFTSVRVDLNVAELF